MLHYWSQGAMHLNWLYLVSLWHGGVHVWSLKWGVICRWGGVAESVLYRVFSEPPSLPSFMAASKQLFYSLIRALSLTRAASVMYFCAWQRDADLHTLLRSLFDHPARYCKARTSPSVMFLHVYKKVALVQLLSSSSSCSDVKCFVWMYLHFFLIHACYVCQLCTSH